MRVLVTGAKGQLGVELLAVLGKTHDVVGLDLPELDITAPTCPARLAALRPEWVVHAAAATDVDRCERDPEWALTVNSLGTRHVVEACQSTGAGLLYLSTDYVFDGRSRVPYREEDPPGPLSAYGRSKLEGEHFTQRLASPWTIVRTAWLYGTHGKNFVKAILDKAVSGGPLRVVDDQVGSPTYATDLARAITELLERKLTGIFHVTNSGTCSWYDFARTILELTGHARVPLVRIGSTELGRPAPRPAYSVLDNGAWRAAGHPPLRPWPDALAAMLTATPPAAAGSGGAIPRSRMEAQ